MKRLLMLLLAGMLTFSIVACDDSDDDKKTDTEKPDQGDEDTGPCKDYLGTWVYDSAKEGNPDKCEQFEKMIKAQKATLVKKDGKYVVKTAGSEDPVSDECIATVKQEGLGSITSTSNFKTGDFDVEVQPAEGEKYTCKYTFKKEAAN